jgi:DNA-directed RNA polymerase specialized sigma24 family protein
MRGACTDDDGAVLGDRALVVALRCGSGAAVREFVLRFRPMLALAARRFGVVGGERDEYADEILHDAAAHFMDLSATVPLSVRGYLLRSLRNRVANAARACARRTRAVAAATEVAGDSEPYFEQAVVGCASEHSVRASHGPGWEGPPPVSPALQRLAMALTTDLTVDERLLVAWLSHHVPQQEIAAWLGLGYEATSKRIRRLRARLHAAAVRYTEHLSQEERRAVMVFLERAAAVPPDAGESSLTAATRRSSRTRSTEMRMR